MSLPVALRHYQAEHPIAADMLECLIPAAKEEPEDDPEDCDSGVATELMTPSVRKKLKNSPLYSKDGQGKKAEVVVKYFNPCGAGTWLITEGKEQKDGDWLLFGMCHIFEWEWGYVMLSELQNARLPHGLRIERDLYSSGTVEELMGECEDEAA